MIITEAAMDRLEKAGWVVTAGLWTAEGHQVYLRRGTEEQIVTVTSRPFLRGRTYGRLSLNTKLGTPVRRRLALATETARTGYQGQDREAFLQGVSAGMGPAKATPRKRGGAR